MSTTATATSASGPDIRQLADRDLPKATFPGDAKSDFRVFIDSKTYSEVHKHAGEDTGVEICGVLVGKWGRDDKGPFLNISASIRGESATNKFAEVTFTHETWSKINGRMDKDFVGYNIVGWYHTHPDFGIFLSDRDRFIHEHFFNEPGQVALVIDPIREQEGIFIWSKGKPTPTPYYWVGDKLKLSTANEEQREKKPKGEKTDAKPAESSSPGGGYTDTLNWITLALACLCFLFLGYFIHERLMAGSIKPVFDALQLERVRLNRDMAEASQNMQLAKAALQRVALNWAGMSEAQRQAAWGEAMERTAIADLQLDQIRRRFAIDANELDQIATMVEQTRALVSMARAASTQQATTAPSMGAPFTPPPASAPTTK